MQMYRFRLILFYLLFFLPFFIARSQFDQATTKKLLENYSLQLFEGNAAGYMGPLVIVSNVGANHGFFESAHVPKIDVFHFELSVQSVFSWVRNDQKNFTGYVPIEDQPNDGPEVRLFKLFLRAAAKNGDLQSELQTSTVFGGPGSWFRIPKNYIPVPAEQLKNIPDSLQLTTGISRDFVFAGVPQVSLGTYRNTQLLLRFIPKVTFDTAVGKFSFFGVAVKHAFTNWFEQFSIDAAVMVSYQHSTIDNMVGVTKAKLAAQTDMFSANIHASKRFNWFEPFLGISYEHLQSNGSYTFTLPANVVSQIGYDIDPQQAKIALADNAVKVTLGSSFHWGLASLFISAGISKQFVLGAGLSYAFSNPF